MRDQPENLCPHCGESFKSGRPSCPHCGSDADTGWLPEDDQEAAVDRSFTHLDEESYSTFLESEGLAPAPQTSEPTRDDEAAHSEFSFTAVFLILALAAAIAWLRFR